MISTKNIKISMRLSISFLIMVIIAVLMGICGIVNINNINSLDTKMYTKMTEPMQYLVSISSSYGSIRAKLRDVLLSTSQNQMEGYKSEIYSYSNDFDTALKNFSNTILTQHGKDITNNLQLSKNKYMSMLDNVVNLALDKKVKDAIKIVHNDMVSVQKSVDDNLSELASLKIKLAKDASGSNDNTAQGSVNTMIALIAIGVIISCALGILISRSINNPINALIKAARKIGDGDLSVNVDDSAKDEIGDLATVFKHMTDNLNEVMSNIDAAAYQVAEGSKQVSDSSIALSQGSTEQASSIQELTASLEQISSQTKLNAENATKVSKISNTAKATAVLGRESMKEMLHSMDEINNSSSKISKIIKVIDDIAFQTNILALNAAVEAARAGQHGKGFAVVAEEVRNLAARSAEAAKETTDMIESSIKKVETGTKIANETSDSLDKIVESIENVATFVNDIARASNEQAEGIEQINQGVMQVAQVVTENSATSQETAAASEELAGQADLLKGQTVKFILRKARSIQLE